MKLNDIYKVVLGGPDDQVPSDTMLIKYFIYFLVTKKNKITTYR